MMKLQYFPKPWKQATIIPIIKPAKNLKSPELYRPISLHSVISKVTEKIILSRLNQHEIDSNESINHCQFGFKAGHKTMQQIARLTNDAIENFNKEEVAVFLDMQKAFEKV